MADWRGQVVVARPPPPSSSSSSSSTCCFPWLEFDTNITGTKEKKMVCVTSGTSRLGLQVVKELLLSGYSVRLTIQDQQEEVDEIHAEYMRIVDSVVIADMKDLRSLCKAFEGCDAVFHTSSFIDPKGISGYLEQMAIVEAKGAENVLEACGRVGSVNKCIFTSSLLACIWQPSGVSGIIDESYWTNEEFCRANKLWLAMGKTVAEKAAWTKSQEVDVKMVSICHGLLTGPTFPCAYDAATIAYLKGGQAMLERQLLATADVKKVAKAQVLIYEAMDKGACGRYLCFDRVLTNENEAIELEDKLKMHGLLSRGRINPSQQEEHGADRLCILNNAKLSNLLTYAKLYYTCNK